MMPTDFNQPHFNPEEQREKPIPELVQFNDGGMGLLYSKPGDYIPLNSPNNSPAHTQNFREPHMGYIRTNSGNVYGIGYGTLINYGLQKTYDLPEEPIHVTIGERCDIPGICLTTQVDSLLLRHKPADPGYSNARQIDLPSPFKELENQVNAIRTVKYTSKLMIRVFERSGLIQLS